MSAPAPHRTRKWAILGVVSGIVVAISVAVPVLTGNSHSQTTRELQHFCDAWSAELARDGGSWLVSGTECQGEPGQWYSVTATIPDDVWTPLDYDRRLGLARALWEDYVIAAGRGNLANGSDSCHIQLQGEQGEKLGGSDWIFGSRIDVVRD